MHLYGSLELGAYQPRAPGRRLLAHFNEDTVVVYQAYKPSIGNLALEHQRIGGPEFSITRATWIKPNFTWMAHRCGWASKPDQEVVLALHLRRSFWNTVLADAVPASYAADSSVFESEAAWKAALQKSDVVMQWDPDHEPFTGQKQPWRFIQLGLKRDKVQSLIDGTAICRIEDVSGYMRELARQQPRLADLQVPVEQEYAIECQKVRRRVLGL